MYQEIIKKRDNLQINEDGTIKLADHPQGVNTILPKPDYRSRAQSSDVRISNKAKKKGQYTKHFFADK